MVDACDTKGRDVMAVNDTGMYTALTIAGSDPGGGAGIQADLKVFAAHGVYGTSAITALTVQNSTGVRGVHAVDAAVVGAIARHSLTRIVLDPIVCATSGASLLDDAGVAALIQDLLPVVDVITP